MSFLAKLMLDGEEFNIIDFEYETHKNSDSNGMPSSKVQAGKMRLVIESNIKIDFYDWATSNTATKDGEIIFYKRDNISSLKTIEFKKAYCLHSKEKFNGEDSKPLRTVLLISAKEMTIRGTTHVNNWPSRN